MHARMEALGMEQHMGSIIKGWRRSASHGWHKGASVPAVWGLGPGSCFVAATTIFLLLPNPGSKLT